MRLVVPILVCAFIGTIILGGIVQILDRRLTAIDQTRDQLELVNNVVVGELLRSEASHGDIVSSAQAAVEKPRVLGLPRTPATILVTKQDKTIIAAFPTTGGVQIGRSLNEYLKDLDVKKKEAHFPDGEKVLVAAQELRAPLGQSITLRSQDAVLSDWRTSTALTVTLTVTTSFVVLVLGFAFHWQASRARERDQIYESMQRRINAALESGRCGLWDWNLNDSQIFWSDSMFELLSLSPADKLLTYPEMSGLIHPADIDIDLFVSQITSSTEGSIERKFRMRDARRGWIEVVARFELISEIKDSSLHLVGIVVEQPSRGEAAERPPVSAPATQANIRDLQSSSTSTMGEIREEPTSVQIASLKNLMRFFEGGAAGAVVGLVSGTAGIVAGNFSFEFTGAGLLAVGTTIAALSVLAGQERYRPDFHEND